MSVRIKAFLIHLAFSSIVGLVTLSLVFSVWYPAPLHKALGVTNIFLTLLLVDIILGPCLTLLVFKEGKKTLLFDLSVILLFQFVALIYGTWTVFSARPAWLVFNVDRFDVVQAVDIDNRKINEAPSDFRSPPWFGPRWVGAARPQNAAQRQEIMFEAVIYGSDIAHRPNLYRPLNNFTLQITDKAMPLQKLYEFNREKSVRKELIAWPNAKSWLPLKARAKPMVVLLAEDSSVLAIVDLRPWD
jgi:hypothetical protein